MVNIYIMTEYINSLIKFTYSVSAQKRYIILAIVTQLNVEYADVLSTLNYIMIEEIIPYISRVIFYVQVTIKVRCTKCFLTSGNQSQRHLPRLKIQAGDTSSPSCVMNFMKHQFPRYVRFWTIELTCSSFKGSNHLLYNFIKKQCGKLRVQE